MNKFLKSNLEKDNILRNEFWALNQIYQIDNKNHMKWWMTGFLALLVVFLCLPWTQNIRAKGRITTLRQENRPQEMNAYIPGRVVKWYVKEGDMVEKGDTIMQLAEVKTEYLDPNLTNQTKIQADAKSISAVSYRKKAESSEKQIAATEESRAYKIASINNKTLQQQLKIASDSADLRAEENALTAYKRQIDGAQKMLNDGALSLIEFEKRKVTYQNSVAKVNVSQNKLNQSRQELINLKIEKSNITQEYAEKIAKINGEKFGSLSDAASADAEKSKLENQLSNYINRKDLLYLIAPQNGQITKAKKAGIGENIKEGDMIVEIVPLSTQKAVELFIEPMDLPLINLGQRVQFIFDGFPAIVFSGWPQTSYGTFAGKIAAIETSSNEYGKFRVLVMPMENEKKWPTALKLGSGAQGIALLKDVQIYYELWRNINGFPPEYYLPITKDEKKLK